MPCVNYMERFVPRILNGTKVHTVRVLGARPHRAGETLYMQTGSRFRPRRFMTRTCIRVRPILIYETTLSIWNEDNSGFIVPPLDVFAQADGFDDWSDLRRFFKKTREPAQLVQWAPAPWEIDTVVKTREGSTSMVSDCCGAKAHGAGCIEVGSGICPGCREHCEFVEAE